MIGIGIFITIFALLFDSPEPKVFLVIVGILFIIIGFIRKKSLKHFISTREQAKINADYCCQECGCGSMDELHVHHIKPKKLGGKDNIENLKVLCKECHEHEHGYEFKDNDAEYSTTRKRYKNSKVEIIGTAIECNSDLEIDYVKVNGEQVIRKIKPKEMYVGENRNHYLIAFDYFRNDKRTFRVSRIKKIGITNLKH